MSADKSLGALLEARASRAQKALLEEARNVAAVLGTPLYLVGGVVRDLLDTGELRDLDLVVEGDGVELARRLAEKIDGHLTTHDRFLTAEVEKEGTRADVVTARNEVYDRPAALPTVAAGTLVDDLSRRDFSVNAMALPLWPSGADELIDPHGGQEDLAERRLRVLHERSFFDAPTRILPGVRLGARLGLEMEPQTEDLAKNAIQSGAFAPLSANRLRRELALLLDAPEVVPSLQELERLGCLEFLGVEDPLEKRDWEIVGRLGHLRESATDVARAEAGLRWWLVYLMATTLGASRRARTRLARRLDLDERLGAILMDGPERVERVTTVLETPRVRPSMMKRALDGLTGEELALLRATIDSGGRERVEEWDRSLRDLRLGISGSDLVTAGYTPGPEIGEVLEATLDARVDGRIRPDEEMEFALAQLAGENSGIGTES